MSHPKDIDERTHAEDELLLVDLLYGERDDETVDTPQSTAKRAHIDKDLEDLSFIRTLFQSLPDEEPPASVTSKLLHAAAMHAPVQPSQRESETKPGFWTWLTSLFRPIVMYPGLAAAASLVLVVTVAGTVYMTGDSRVSTTQQATPSVEQPGDIRSLERKEVRSATAANQPDDNLKASEKLEHTRTEPSPVPAVDGNRPVKNRLPSPEVPFDSTSDLGGVPPTSSSLTTTMKKNKKRKASRSKTKAPTRKMPPRTGRPFSGQITGQSNLSANLANDVPTKDTWSGEDSTSNKRVNNNIDSDGLNDTEDTRAVEDADNGANAAPQLESEPEKKQSSASKSADKNDSKTNERARARSLHSEAQNAVRQNDCATVAEIGSKIRNLDIAYYRNRFLKDSSLAACIAKIAK